MQTVIKLAFIFMIGGSVGWILELIFRRVVHKKWINPGFLAGPCLPLYGTGLVGLYLVCSADYSAITSSVARAIVIIAILTVLMTAVEYVTGLIFIKGMKVRLWDYSDRKWNIQGIICPLFTLFWAIIAAVYYLFLHKHVANAAAWICDNLAFSFCVGMYFGVLIVDVCYSFHLITKIKGWASERNVVVKYESLKLSIHNRAQAVRRRVSFVLPFGAKSKLSEELDNYNSEQENK